MTNEIHDVVFFSGGISSWAVAKRVAERPETTKLRLLFTDTLIEDLTLYKFLHHAAANVGGELISIADGRTPFQVFADVKYLGNTRADPCSRILKRDLSKKWIKDNYPDPESVRLWLGMNWDEEHRLVRAQKNWAPYWLGSTLLEKPLLTQPQLIELAKEEGLEIPRLYELGFPHNNCGGGCIKSGMASFRHLHKMLPEVYKEWEEGEEKIRKLLDKDVAILRDRSGGTVTPLTLKQLRLRDDKDVDMFEWGGCGCFSDVQEDE